MMKLLELALTLFVLCGLIVTTTSFKKNFTILHFNDINSQIDTFDKSNPELYGKYGGLASLIGLLETEENKTDNALRVAPGNLLGGHNGWLSLVGWKEFGELVKEFYQPDIFGLGHKEFEGGLEKLNDYLISASSKVLISNVNCSDPHPGSEEQKFCHDHVTSMLALNITSNDGKEIFQVGVVGFVNPIVERLADPGSLSFEDPDTALERTVSASKDIKAFIAIGSGSLDIAKAILSKTDKIKLVVLSGGTYDQYPVQLGDRYIVKAGNLGTTFGKVVLEVDSESDANAMRVIEAQLIENDGSTMNREAEEQVDNLRNQTVTPASTERIGNTLVKLNGSRENCWRSECNVGNLIADAMVNCALRKMSLPEAATTVGIWPSGSMFESVVYGGSEISKLDVHKWLPYHNQAYLVTVTGTILKRVFDSSGGAINAPENGEKYWGQFLQVSGGIEVKYSAKGEVQTLRVYHLNDSQPILEQVQDNLNYNLVIPSFMFSGRSVYDYLPGNFNGVPSKTDIGPDDDCLYNYINGIKVLNVGFEKRITIGDEDGGGGECAHCSGANTAVTVVLTLFIFLLIVGLAYVAWKFVWPRISQRGHTASFP